MINLPRRALSLASQARKYNYDDDIKFIYSSFILTQCSYLYNIKEWLNLGSLCYLLLISPVFGRISTLLLSRLPAQMRMYIKLRSLILKLLASILTSVITFLFTILKILTMLPFPPASHIYRDFLYNISCCSVKVNLQHSVFLVINSTFSLLSALIIANYC